MSVPACIMMVPAFIVLVIESPLRSGHLRYRPRRLDAVKGFDRRAGDSHLTIKSAENNRQRNHDFSPATVVITVKLSGFSGLEPMSIACRARPSVRSPISRAQSARPFMADLAIARAMSWA